MHDYDTIVRERQKLVRREIEKSDKLSVTAVYCDGGWKNSSSVLSWFPADKDAQPAIMSIANLYRLLDTKALPPELLSMLLPEGFAIVRKPEGINHDEIGEWADQYSAKKLAAHRKDSECEERIGPNEQGDLDSAVLQFPAARVG